MKLIIVESSSKCKKIEELLDNEYQCVACQGHIREISTIKNIYECYYKNMKKNLDKLKKCIKLANEIILATDDDREGESIAWHICQEFSLNIKTTKRIIFNEITRDALVNAINNPTTINMNIVEAATTRMILDRTVGFKISPILWKNINRASKLSAGRCQTPALRIIYENHKEIKESSRDFIYKITTSISNVIFELKRQLTEEEEVTNFLEMSINFVHNLSRKQEQVVKKKPPIPFITSSLQQSASNKYNMSPKNVMMIAQKLYQTGKITYMRTDNPNLSIECSEKIKEMILKKYGDKYLGVSNYVHKSKKYAHECIRPTNVMVSDIDNNYSPQERNIYKMIWRQTIQSCMAEASGLSYLCCISAPMDTYYFHKFEKLTFLGFLMLQENNLQTKYEMFKNIAEGPININKVSADTNVTNLKQHYTEAKLVKLLESHGIGRPSTYAILLDKIKEKGYVEKTNIDGFPIECTNFILEKKAIKQIDETKIFGSERNKLLITPLGIIVIEFCLANFSSLFEYIYTKNMEDHLDKIASGKEDRKNICIKTDDDINKLIQNIKKKDENYEIEKNHYYIIGKYGPCIKVKGDNGEKDSFLSIKNGISLDDIKTKQLKIKDLVENNIIGEYQGEKLFLMKGKFGTFTKYKGQTYSLKNINATLNNVIKVIESTISNTTKKITNDISIRKGRFGHYVYYKTQSMTKPLFLGLKKYKLTINSTIGEIEDVIEKYYDSR